jgi:hypothetical protein
VSCWPRSRSARRHSNHLVISLRCGRRSGTPEGYIWRQAHKVRRLRALALTEPDDGALNRRMRRAMMVAEAHARGACTATSREGDAETPVAKKRCTCKIRRVPEQSASAALLFVNLRRSPHISEHAMQRWASIQRRSHKLQPGSAQRRRPRRTLCAD